MIFCKEEFMVKSHGKLSRAVAGIIGLMMLAAGCSQPSGGENTAKSSGGGGTSSLEGKVILNSGSADSSGVRVYLEKVGQDGAGESARAAATAGRTVSSFYAGTETDADGNYEFTELAAGEWTVYAVSGNEAAYTKVALEEGKRAAAPDLTLTLKGNISGVISVDGGSAAGAIVGIAGTSYMAVCGDDGKFTVSGIPAGTHKLCVWSGGNCTSFETEYTVAGGKTADAGEIKVSAGSGNPNYVTCTPTEHGIRFSGNLLYYYNSGSYSSGTQYITIRDTVNDVEMRNEESLGTSYFSYYYPLVEKGKDYSFTVTIKFGNVILSTSTFNVKAAGGLGELLVTNSSALSPVLTSDRVMRRNASPEFSAGFSGKILRQGTWYQLARGTSWDDSDSYWMISDVRWNDDTDGTYPLKDSLKISYWRDYEYIDNMLSGNSYFIESATYVRIAGFVYGDSDYSSVFKLNDWALKSGDWGGEKKKVLTVYGLYVDGQSVYSASEAEKLGITVDGAPGDGKERTVVNSDSSPAETVSSWSEISFFGDTLMQPQSLFKSDKYRFSRYSGSDVAAGTSSCTVSGDTAEYYRNDVTFYLTSIQ